MPEVTRVSIDAPHIKSKHGVMMEPVIPKDSHLENLPDGHRVYRASQDPTEKLYIKREGQNFIGYDSFDSAKRAFDHVIQRETSTTEHRTALLESQPENQAQLTALLDRYQAIKTKYQTLDQQFEALREERRALDHADIDLQELALESITIQDLRQGVLARTQALKSTVGLKSDLTAENDSTLNQIIALRFEVRDRLAKIPLPIHPGWVLVAHEVY